MSAIEKPNATLTPAASAPLLRTLALCDLADSTALIERLGDQRAAELIRKHDRLTRDILHRHGGQEIDKTDGFLVLFERPIQAVAFSLEYQRRLRQLSISEGIELRARVGIHVGDVLVWDNAPDDIAHGAKPVEVEGLVKPMAARLMALARPGQVLLSGVTFSLAQRAVGELDPADAERLRWRSHGPYRFKGVAEPVPVYEAGERELGAFKTPPSSAKAYRALPWWRRPVALVSESLVLLIGICLTVYFISRPEPAIAFAARDWVVLGDLQNLTGESLFDSSLDAALRIGLEQSRFVNALPDLQVRSALRRMERDPGTKVDRAIGSEVAMREGARALILASVSEIGGRVRIAAEVIDPKTQATVYSEMVDGKGAESVLPSMDALLERIRGRLGESLNAIKASTEPLEKVTTGNLEALKAYSLGIKALGAGKAQDANAMFQQAIRLDPAFASAYLKLGGVYYYTGDKALAHDFIERAAQQKERLSARDRLYLDGYESLFSTPARMKDAWALLANLYPDFYAGQQNLGHMYWWYDNDFARAVRPLSEVSDSQHPLRGFALVALGRVQLAQGQFDAAEKSFARAKTVGAAQVNVDSVDLYTTLRNYPRAQSELDTAVTNGFPFYEAEKAFRLAALRSDRMELTGALAAVERAEQEAGRGKLVQSRQRARLAQLAILAHRGEHAAGAALKQFVADEGVRLADASKSYDYSPVTHLLLAAIVAARSQDKDLAERAAGLALPIARSSGFATRETLAEVVQSELLLLQGKIDQAIDLLNTQVNGREVFQTHVSLLRAYALAKQPERADAEAEWLQKHRGQAFAEWNENYAAEIPNILDANEASVTAAEIAADAGNRELALRRLDQARLALATADPGLPSSKRLAALEQRLDVQHKKR